MIKSLLSVLLLIPLAILLIALSVANRQNVTLVFDPFSPENPALALTIPLFLALFAALILGVILGGMYIWLRQGRYRRAARNRSQEAIEWRHTAERERQRAEDVMAITSDKAPVLPAPKMKKAG